jgi:hypothetical protein
MHNGCEVYGCLIRHSVVSRSAMSRRDKQSLEPTSRQRPGSVAPIQTRHAGCLFRSRLEAHWALGSVL